MAYPGQGERVPEPLGHGVWLYKPVVWLSISDPRTEPPPPDGDIESIAAQLPDGSSPIELGAARIAAQMRVPIDELLLANRDGKITLANWPVPARRAGEVAVRLKVTYGDLTFEITHARSKLS